MKKRYLILSAISTSVSIVVFSALQQKAVANINSNTSTQHLNFESSFRKFSNEKEFQLQNGLTFKVPGTNPRLDEIGSLHWDIIPKPFPISKTKGHYSWTSGVGLSEEDLLQFANNSDMLETLQKDNEFTLARQLVYVNETINDDKNLIIDGELTHFILPGLDGEEIEIEIIDSNRLNFEDNDDEAGAFIAVVKGYPDSHVSVGIFEDSWAIDAHFGDRYVSISNRSPDEWIVSEIDSQAHNASNDHSCKEYRLGGDVGELIVSPD